MNVMKEVMKEGCPRADKKMVRIVRKEGRRGDGKEGSREVAVERHVKRKAERSM